MPADSRRWWLDIVVGIGYTVSVAITILLLGVTGPLRAVLALPFILFVPGYAALVALYPDRKAEGVTPRDQGHGMGVDLTSAGIAPGERFVGSFLASGALVPTIALVVNFSAWEITVGPMVIGISVVTLLCFVVGFVRRVQLPPDERGGIAPGAALTSAVGQFRVHSSTLLDSGSNRPTSGREVVLNGFVALAVLAVVVGAGFAYAAPTAGQEFTEFYLVAENETGAYTINAVPSTLATGQSEPVVPTVTNQLGHSQTYTVVVQRQTVGQSGGNVTVVDRTRVAVFETTTTPGQTVHLTHSLGPFDEPGEYRIVYLLYKGDPPPNPSLSNANRSLRLSITVTSGGQG